MARIPGNRPPIAFDTPREEYVYGGAGLMEVILRWQGQKSWTEKSIRYRHDTEGWKGQREQFVRVLANERTMAFARKLADLESDELSKAIKRHRQLGYIYQQVPISKQRVVEKRGPDGVARKEVIFVDNGEQVQMTASDIRNFGKDGVAMERKALGLADEVIRVEFAQTLVEEVWTCITKYVDDPATIRNLGEDIHAVLLKREEALEVSRQETSK
jgi:hypothetical protein